MGGAVLEEQCHGVVQQSRSSLHQPGAEETTVLRQQLEDGGIQRPHGEDGARHCGHLSTNQKSVLSTNQSEVLPC